MKDSLQVVNEVLTRARRAPSVSETLIIDAVEILMYVVQAQQDEINFLRKHTYGA